MPVGNLKTIFIPFHDNKDLLLYGEKEVVVFGSEVLRAHREDASEHCAKVRCLEWGRGRLDEANPLLLGPWFSHPVERSQGQRGRPRHSPCSGGQGNSVSASSRTYFAACCQPGCPHICKIGKSERGEILNYKLLLIYRKTFLVLGARTQTRKFIAVKKPQNFVFVSL